MIAEFVTLISEISSIFAATIAATAAYWIATRVYRDQKKIDAEVKLAERRHNSYLEFFCAATDMHTELRASLYRGIDGVEHFKNGEKCLHRVYRTQEALALTVGKRGAGCCREYTLALLGLREYVSKELFGTEISEVYNLLLTPEDAIENVLKHRKVALITARSDVLGESKIIASDRLEKLLSRVYPSGSVNLKVETMRALRSDQAFSDANPPPEKIVEQ